MHELRILTKNLAEYNLMQTFSLAMRGMIELANLEKDHSVLSFSYKNDFEWNPNAPFSVATIKHHLVLQGEEPYLEQCKTTLQILLRASDLIAATFSLVDQIACFPANKKNTGFLSVFSFCLFLVAKRGVFF